MSKSTKANNSALFIQAHRMTRLTIQKGYIYRYVFGQWLKFLATGVTNYIRPSSINKECAMVLNASVPILKHDTEGKGVFITPFKVSKVISNNSGSRKYIQTYNIDTMMISFMLSLLDSKLFISLLIIMQFMLVLKFI